MKKTKTKTVLDLTAKPKKESVSVDRQNALYSLAVELLRCTAIYNDTQQVASIKNSYKDVVH